MQYLCVLKLTLGGKAYYPGDVIPDGVILPARASKLIQNGYIAEAGSLGTVEAAEETGKVMVPVIMEGENDSAEVLNVPLTEAELQHILVIMQMEAKAGVKEVSRVDSEDALIVLHACDSRKSVKEAAQKRAGTLSSTEDGENEACTDNASTDTDTEGVDA